ncbi:MAG: hypothetical protein QM479_05265 [Pseudomonadota bacterium]
MNKFILSFVLITTSLPVMADDISDVCSLMKTFSTAAMSSRQRGATLATHLLVMKTGIEAIDGVSAYPLLLTQIKGVAAAAWNVPILASTNDKLIVAKQFGQLVETRCITDLRGE